MSSRIMQHIEAPFLSGFWEVGGMGVEGGGGQLLKTSEPSCHVRASSSERRKLPPANLYSAPDWFMFESAALSTVVITRPA